MNRSEETFAEYKKRDGFEAKINAFGRNIPSPIDSFESADLDYAVWYNLRRMRFRKPVEILPHAIPAVMAGRDLLVSSWFDSVMVASFMVPAVHHFLSDPPEYEDTLEHPHTLVLVPSRSVGEDVCRLANGFVKNMGMTVGVLNGATVFHRLKHLALGMPNVAIATPCSLTQLLHRQIVCLEHVKFIVLIYTDQLTSFAQRAKRILEHKTMPPKKNRQTLAYLTHHTQKRPTAVLEMLHNPVYVINIPVRKNPEQSKKDAPMDNK